MKRTISPVIAIAILTAILFSITFIAGIKTGERRVIRNQVIVSDTLIDYDGNLYEYE